MEIAGLSFFGGSIVGGFIQSKNAYLNWMETNRGTQFTDHFEAKVGDYYIPNFCFE